MTDDPAVTMLAPCYWPEVRRGTERTIHGLSRELLARGQEVRLITSAPQRRPTYDVEDGLPILRLPRPPDRRHERRMYEHYVTHVPLSYLALRAWGGDVAHAWYQADARAAGRWARRTGKPAILSYMGVPDPHGMRLRRMRLEITVEATKAVDVVVGVSDYVAFMFRKWLGVQARTIYPPIDVDAFRPMPGQRSEEPSIFCAAGAEEHRKRIHLLVAAHKHVRSEHPKARLWLLEPSRPDLKEALEAPGVEFVDPGRAAEHLPRLYASAWVSALPSLGDAFGMVLAEALACGTPVVATNSDALPEVVDRPEIGRLFDGDEPKALAKALLEAIELSQDPGTAAACRARAEDFSPQRCADQYQALYRELAG